MIAIVFPQTRRRNSLRVFIMGGGLIGELDSAS